MISRTSSSGKKTSFRKLGLELRTGDKFVKYRLDVAYNTPNKVAYISCIVSTIIDVRKKMAAVQNDIYCMDGHLTTNKYVSPLDELQRTIIPTHMLGHYVENADELITEQIASCFTGERVGSWSEMQQVFAQLRADLHRNSEAAIKRRSL